MSNTKYIAIAFTNWVKTNFISGEGINRGSNLYYDWNYKVDKEQARSYNIEYLYDFWEDNILKPCKND
jgi:hypothetical protein